MTKPPYLLSTSAYYYQQYHNVSLWTLYSSSIAVQIAAVVTTARTLCLMACLLGTMPHI